MAKVLTKKVPSIKILGYELNDKEFNLAREFKRIIELAFYRYPHERMEYVADKLGISSRTLSRAVEDWDIVKPRNKYNASYYHRKMNKNRGVLKNEGSKLFR